MQRALDNLNEGAHVLGHCASFERGVPHTVLHADQIAVMREVASSNEERITNSLIKRGILQTSPAAVSEVGGAQAVDVRRTIKYASPHQKDISLGGRHGRGNERRRISCTVWVAKVDKPRT